MKRISVFKFLLFVEIILLNFNLILCKVSNEVLELPGVDAYVTINLRESPENRDDIFEAIEHYRAVLYKVLRTVLHHDRWTMEDATYVHELGKPRFLNEPIDMKTLGKKHGWHPGHFTGLVLLKSEIEQFWNEFTERYKILKEVYNL